MLPHLHQLLQVPGAGRGKSLTVPTINFAVPSEISETPYGVYAGRLTTSEKTYTIAIHYGPIPTFSDIEPRLEVNLIDEFGIVFPRETIFSINFIRKIRDIQTFPNPESLKKQILLDIDEIRKILAKE